jgi:hypothetical protein
VLLLEPREDATERARVEVVFCEGLVHALLAPVVTARVQRLVDWTYRRLDGREIKVAKSFRRLADD